MRLSSHGDCDTTGRIDKTLNYTTDAWKAGVVDVRHQEMGGFCSKSRSFWEKRKRALGEARTNSTKTF
jgi:hypothetical protein